MILTVTAGHGLKPLGGFDPGATTMVKTGAWKFERVSEADLMTELRDIVASKLRDAGHTVRTDGARLQNLPLAKAITLVPGAAWAIELHTNSVASPGATGVEVLSLPKHKGRAQALAMAIAAVLGLPLRGESGWRPQSASPHGSLGFVGAGGMVVETFFLSNPGDLAAYQAKKWMVASAIVQVMVGHA